MPSGIIIINEEKYIMKGFIIWTLHTLYVSLFQWGEDKWEKYNGQVRENLTQYCSWKMSGEGAILVA
jgi:hypothetical protein